MYLLKKFMRGMDSSFNFKYYLRSYSKSDEIFADAYAFTKLNADEKLINDIYDIAINNLPSIEQPENMNYHEFITWLVTVKEQLKARKNLMLSSFKSGLNLKLI